MKILIDGRPLLEQNRCGVGTYALEIAQALALNHDHELTIWGSGLKSNWPPELEKSNSKLILTRTPNKLINAGFSLLKRPLIEDFVSTKPDLVYLPNLNFIATKLPYAVTVHDLSFIHFPEFFPPKGRAWHRAINPSHLISNAAHVIAVSNHTKQDLIEIFKIADHKITVVPPGIIPASAPQKQSETDRIKKHYSLPDRYFLFVGAIEPRKNIEGLIKAFSQLSGKEHLVIAGGKGWLNRQVYNLAKKSPHAKKIHFLGYVPAKDKAALYTSATALVYPSFYEGFGIPLIEAMACGTPIIASQVSSLPEVVGNAGLLVNPHDINSISEAMSALATSSRMRLEFQTRGQKRAQDFSWQKSSAILSNALNKIAT